MEAPGKTPGVGGTGLCVLGSLLMEKVCAYGREGMGLKSA